MLFILLVRGLTLEGALRLPSTSPGAPRTSPFLRATGASTGLRYYLTPDFSKLTDGKVWIAAASQIFYSTGIGWGTLIAFASYNAPSHNFVRDAWLVPLINCGTSFLAGLVVFSVLGYLANLRGVEVASPHSSPLPPRLSPPLSPPPLKRLLTPLLALVRWMS